MASRALVIAGLSSGAGKTTVTLGLLRALHRQGMDIAAAKTGPDYIDCAFLAAASRHSAVNLDSFAMSAEMIHDLAVKAPGQTLIVEGVMGLFDGTDGGRGATVEVAAQLGAGIVLVIDARHQAQTAAAIAAGLAQQLPENTGLAGVILNRVASPRHQALIAAALAERRITLFGSLPQNADISVPSRHLGLVQSADLATEGRLETLLEAAADLVETHLDCTALFKAARPLTPLPSETSPSSKSRLPLNPPCQHIALATDAGFGFHYAHMISAWRECGAEITPFSPLNDEAPDPGADFIFLPGGYPELHLPTLSSAHNFKAGLHKAAQNGTVIYGECGGFMTLGQRIFDVEGTGFEMVGLLPLETSFAARKLHLGYRLLTPKHPLPWLGKAPIRAHEFHYTTPVFSAGHALFSASDASGKDLGDIGLIEGSVAGSYAHIIA